MMKDFKVLKLGSKYFSENYSTIFYLPYLRFVVVVFVFGFVFFRKEIETEDILESIKLRNMVYGQKKHLIALKFSNAYLLTNLKNFICYSVLGSLAFLRTSPRKFYNRS